MQFMGAFQAKIAAWVVYQPEFVEGLEFRPCMPFPGIAVLDGYPLLHGKVLPYSSGTIDLAKRIGIPHPKVSYEIEAQSDEPGYKAYEPFPLISDLLCIFRVAEGIRAVNLCATRDIYELSPHSPLKKENRLIQAYYAESGIPTAFVSESELHPIVTKNLVIALKLGLLSNDWSVDLVAAVIDFMSERLYFSAPYTWRQELYEKFGVTHEAVFRIFHYGVFKRCLKVDLTLPVAMDRVHKPEKENFATHFAGRFLEALR